MKAMKTHRAFTIVELLIVIVVIAILAAVAIVSYAAIVNKAADSGVQTDLANIGKKIQLFRLTNDRFPEGNTDLASMNVKVGKSAYSRGLYNGTSWYNLLYCWANDTYPDKFALVAQARSGNVYQYVDGTVSKVAYAFVTGSPGICQSAGVDISTSGRDWFYDNDMWQQYAK